jgi:Cytochrome oxidase complex assembly protein 1
MTTKKILLIFGGIFVTVGLLVVVFVGAIVGFVLYQVGNSEAATEAKQFLRSSDKLKEEIGEVKDFGRIVTGSVNIQNDYGTASLYFKVIGERKTVNASVVLTYLQGRWRVSSASYTNNRDQTVNLLDPYESRRQIPTPDCLIGISYEA